MSIKCREWNPIPASRPKAKKAKKPIPHFSEAGKKKNLEYKKLQRQFLIDHPYCQHYMAENGIDEQVAIDNMGIVLINRDKMWFYVTVPRSSEVHHRKGRGKYLLDVSTWMACRHGHAVYIHLDPKRYEKGYCEPRN